MKPAFGEKQQSIVGVGVVVFLLIAVPLSLLETGGWQAACISGLSAMFWGVGWSWWLTLVAEGPSWFVGLMDPTYAKKRRAAFPKRADWTERDDFVAGTVLGPLGDMLAVPDGGEPAIAWHARGRSKSHVIDDAALVSFLMLTDDDERVAVIASREVLIELDPSERGVLDSPFLTQRGFGVAPPDRLMLRRLEIGHRVEVSGSAGEMRDPDAGYRGGMLRTLEAGEAPLVVCYASSS